MTVLLTEDQDLKLAHAAGLLTEVQVDLLRRDSQHPLSERTEEWRELSLISERLRSFMKFMREHADQVRLLQEQAGTQRRH